MAEGDAGGETDTGGQHETIREFLIGLGYKNDAAGERRFTGAIESATLKANLLATALEDMARKGADVAGGLAWATMRPSCS